MSSSHDSNPSSDELQIPTGPSMNPPTNGFGITTQDATILKGYIDEFEKADTQVRNKILEKTMGERYRLRPGDSSFNKKEAKQVPIQSIHVDFETH
jgi:hypothetical protein